MKALAYSRYSPRRVRKNEGGKAGEVLSNEVQFARIRSWCAARGYPIVAEYQDEFASGGSMDGRQGFQDALEHVKRIKGILVCYSLSRFARCTRDALNVAHELDAAGCCLALLDFDMDTSKPSGRAMFTILAAFAQFHRETQNELTSDSMLAQQASGRRMSRHAPVGMMIDPKDSSRLIVSNDELQLVARIKEAAGQLGYGAVRMAGWCESNGLNFRGGPVSVKVVSKAIKGSFATPPH